MLLRGRIVVIASVALALSAAVLSAAAWVLIESSDQRLRHANRANEILVWTKTLESNARDTLRALDRLAVDAALRQANEAQDRSATIRRLTEMLQGTEGSLPFERLELIGADGQLLYSNGGVAVDTPLIDAPGVAALLQNSGSIVGLEPDATHGLAVAVTVGLEGGGLLSATAEVMLAVRQVGASFGAEAYLLDRSGKLVVGTDERYWPHLTQRLARGDENPTLEYDGHILKALEVDVQNSVGRPVGRLVILRDETAERERRKLVATGTAVASAMMILLVLTSLYGYLRRTLEPLEDISRVVKGLSRGDTLLAVEVPSRADEIGNMAAAVDVFRRTAIDLEKIQFRRRRERRRSEKLIRDKMLEMAETLDPESRADIIEDLSAIESQTKSMEAHDGGAVEAAGMLAVAFRRMASRVVDQYRQVSALLAERTRDLAVVRQALAEREQLIRLRQELEVARTLQLSSLPAQFPAFPDRPEFDIFAAMRPAKEVGGDFYDFFLVGDHKIAVAVGDASDKGVSSAMVVAMVRSLLKASCLRGSEPGECLTSANAVLAADNPQMMFTTAFYALLDTRDGRILASNAGHNPPYILRRDGRIDRLSQFCGPALGVMDEASYPNFESYLQPGDMLFLYSDGVTDANDDARALFDRRRLESALEIDRGCDARQVVERVQRALDSFVGAAAQADDITMLAVKYVGAARSVTAIPARAAVSG